MGWEVETPAPHICDAPRLTTIADGHGVGSIWACDGDCGRRWEIKGFLDTLAMWREIERRPRI